MARNYGSELGAGIEDLGGSLAKIIGGYKQAGAAAAKSREASGILSAALAEQRGADAANEPGAPKLVGGAVGLGPKDPFASPRDMLHFLDRIGRLEGAMSTGLLPDLISLSTGRPAADEQFVPMDDAGKAVAAARYGLSPDAFRGGWEWQPSSGHVRQVVKPDELAGPKWQHVGGGMFVDMNDPSKAPIDQQEVYRREMAMRSAGASRVNVNVPDGSARLTQEMRNLYAAKRATLSTARSSFDALKQYQPNMIDRVAGAAGFKGPQGAAADSARNALLFSIAKLAEQGALQAPDRAVAEGMIGQIFDPRIGPETRDAAMNQFEKWLDSQERGNEGMIATVPPESAPVIQPGAPGQAKAQATPAGPPRVRIKLDAKGNIVK